VLAFSLAVSGAHGPRTATQACFGRGWGRTESLAGKEGEGAQAGMNGGLPLAASTTAKAVLLAGGPRAGKAGPPLPTHLNGQDADAVNRAFRQLLSERGVCGSSLRSPTRLPCACVWVWVCVGVDVGVCVCVCVCVCV
jgi:hypothetical protein